MIARNTKIANIYLLIILSLTYTAAAFWPLLRYGMLFIIIGFVMPLIICRNFYGTKIFAALVVYLIIVASNVVMGDNYFKNNMSLLYESAYLFIPASMIFYMFSSGDFIIQKRTIILFYIILCLTTIVTTFFSMQYASLVRNSAGSDINFYAGLFRLGFTNYFFPHALPSLVPPVVLGLRIVKHNSKISVLLWVALFILLLMAYLSGSFACLVLALFGLIVSYVIRPGTVRVNLRKVLIWSFILSIVLTTSVRTTILDGLLSNMNSESDFYEKILELKDIEEAENISMVEGDVNARRELYAESFEQGVGSIIIGSDGSNLGGHSALLDRFGTLGLLGMIPYFLFLTFIVTFTVKNIPINYRIYYWVGLLISIIMLLVKAIYHWDQWITTLVILPISINLLANMEEVVVQKKLSKEG